MFIDGVYKKTAVKGYPEYYPAFLRRTVILSEAKDKMVGYMNTNPDEGGI